MKKKLITVIATVLSMVMLLTMPCDAAKIYYTSVAKIENQKIYTTERGTMNFTSMQGMAVGSQYAYTAKLPVVSNKVVEDYACIVKTDTVSGKETTLTCNGKKYITGTGHANDMCVTSYEKNKSTLFISATNSANTKEENLLKMSVSGSTITKTGAFKIRYNNKPLAITGISILEHPNNKNGYIITFLIKSKNKLYPKTDDIYTVRMHASETKGTITAKKVFTLEKEFVKSNGVRVDYTGYANQGFSYYNDKLYLPLSGQKSEQNKSVVLVYNNIKDHAYDNSVGERIQPDKNTIFEISDSNYGNLLEIESCGICTGEDNFKLYFNTNRRKTSTDADWDGLHYVNGYKAK
ncbi:MAG: hypothetical protein UH080_08815 [Ruminococcus sp.]|nr:hypothetical protein [Ruminococcus sp.]